MKKSISVLVLAFLASGMSLTAQNRGNEAPQGAGEKMGKPGMGMMKELNLTDDQKAKLKVLHEGFAAQDSVTRVQMMKQREGIRAERELALAKILTPEQLAQLDKIRVEKGQKAGKKGQFGPGNDRQGFRKGGFGAGQGRGQMMGMGRGQMGQERGQMMGQPRGQMGQGRGRMMNNAPMVNPEVRIKNQVDRMTKQLDLTPEQAAKIQAIQEKHFKGDIAKFKKFEKKRDAQMKKRHGYLDEIKAVLTPEQAKKLDALKEQGPKMERPDGPMSGPSEGRN